MCRPGNDAAPIGTLDQLDGSLEIQLSCKVGILLSILYELHLWQDRIKKKEKKMLTSAC